MSERKASFLDFTRGHRLITDGHGGFTGGPIWNTRSRAKFTDGARFFTGGTGFIGTLMQFAFRLSEKLPFLSFTRGGRVVTGGRGGFTGGAVGNTRSLDKFTGGAGSFTGGTGFIGSSHRWQQ